MESEEFLNECKYRICYDHNDKVDTLKGENDFIQKEDIHCVWFSKTLQNFKGLFIPIPLNGKYYECTYNGIKKELYLDVYKKEDNKCIDLKENLNKEEK